MAEQVTRSLKMAGEWWLPDKYEDRLLGTLTWKPNVGCELKLIDDSSDFKWDMSDGIIVGLNSEQEPVTLLGCSNNGGWNLKHIGRMLSFGHNVRGHSAMVGVLFEGEEDIAITDLAIGYAGLDDYIIERYYEVERTQDSQGLSQFGPVTFSIPQYEVAKTSTSDVGLVVSFSLGSELRLQHKLNLSFPETSLYRSEGTNLKLVHVILPAFLAAMMGHQSFVTSQSSFTDRAPVEIFDGYHEQMSWDGNPSFKDRLVLGKEKTLALWPRILPAWVDNYEAIADLCSAYVKILSDGRDGFFEVNNLVHLFFGLERYYKVKRNKARSTLWRALTYTICRIDSYFESVEKYIQVADSIDIGDLNDARNTLVHSNEDEPDYPLVYRQLIFITRCVLLMEMDYPVDNIQQETQHWDLWQSFSKGRK